MDFINNAFDSLIELDMDSTDKPRSASQSLAFVNSCLLMNRPKHVEDFMKPYERNFREAVETLHEFTDLIKKDLETSRMKGVPKS